MDNDLVEELKSIHGNKYEYLGKEGTGKETYLIVNCPEHGKFKQLLRTHRRGAGCVTCGRLKFWQNRKEKYGDEMFENFVTKSRAIHKDKYEYDKDSYLNRPNNDKVKIFCKVHGEFLQQPNIHVAGHGCPKCAKKHNLGRYNKKFFKKHPDKKNIPAILYLVEIDNFYKIGVTKNDAKTRLGFYRKKMKILCENKMTLYEAFLMEQSILKEFKKWQYIPKEVKGRGGKECFSKKVPISELLNKFKGE